jgi:hypothetical protein
VYELSAIRHERTCRTSYEIHVRTGSGWGVRTHRAELEEAVREAKLILGQPGTEAVRVVRDLYDPATGSFKPNTMFRAAVTANQVPVPRFPARWRSWRALLPAALKAKRWRPLTASLAVSVAAIGLGTAITWLRS